MPYIEEKDRFRFGSNISSVIKLITNNQESWYNRGDYFGYYVNRLVKNWVTDPTYQNNIFNSEAFQKEKRQNLANAADSIAVTIGRSDPFGGAGNLNYSISAVYWALLGCKKDIPTAKYGTRAYLRGYLIEISETTNISGGAQSNADLAKAGRRRRIAKGVLGDVQTEAYDRHTRPYEDEKLEENGDIWPLVIARKR